MNINETFSCQKNLFYPYCNKNQDKFLSIKNSFVFFKLFKLFSRKYYERTQVSRITALSVV